MTEGNYVIEIGKERIVRPRGYLRFSHRRFAREAFIFSYIACVHRLTRNEHRANARNDSEEI